MPGRGLACNFLCIEVIVLLFYWPCDQAVGVDAGQAEHEDGGDDEEKVKTSKTNQ